VTDEPDDNFQRLMFDYFKALLLIQGSLEEKRLKNIFTCLSICVNSMS